LRIGSFIYREMNTFRLSKFSKIGFAFTIFVPIPVQKNGLFKGNTKKSPQWTFCVGDHQSKNVSEKN